MGQAAAAPVTGTGSASGATGTNGATPSPGPLAVVVAATLEERTQVLTQMSGNAPVLIVSSFGQAQELMTAVQQSATERGAIRPDPTRPDQTRPSGAVADGVPGAADGVPGGGEAPAMRLHEDRRAADFGTAEVSLTPLEFALMRLLITEVGRVWRFDELVHRVWRTEHIGDVSQVHAVVKRLRAKLATAGAPIAIEAVRGVGFRAARRRRPPPPSPHPSPHPTA